MFCSNLYYFSGYFISKKQNLIVKIFQNYSFRIQISFENDSIGHVFLVLNYCLYFNIEKGHNFYYLCLFVESLVNTLFLYSRTGICVALKLIMWFSIKYEPQHVKTNKMTCEPSLIRVFAVSMKKPSNDSYHAMGH